MNKFTHKNPLVALAALTLLMLSPARAEPAQPTPTPSARVASRSFTYDSFRLVHTRNVFDPDRRPFHPVNNAPMVPVTRADYAALTGTLLNADKTYAFFSGSRSEFNRVLTVREKIANATITEITALNIVVERDGKRTTIAVGQTVPFDNQTTPGAPPIEAPVAISSTDSASPASSPSSAPLAAAPRPVSGGASTASTTSKGPPANVDEIRRRMMEKRQQELK